ncbi:hypothetical protein RF11_04785 [Thelohanellus kitauei]|uniref:Uncharacterized protein n=1 Tax=Thelohanellus kitauei TaxID=669202 RepID=A0A0C2IAV1_THEKT|nr:hypothetical protein RF11_04785 [Thelohanellus kitauei]
MVNLRDDQAFVYGCLRSYFRKTISRTCIQTNRFWVRSKSSYGPRCSLAWFASLREDVAPTSNSKRHEVLQVLGEATGLSWRSLDVCGQYTGRLVTIREFRAG